MNTRRSGAGSDHSFVETKPDLYPINAKICQLVEQFPCMYDRSHPHYLKKEVVERAWVKIAKEMNDSISLCKERWRNIRTSFARSINVRKVPASANRTKPYYLHEELKFLTHHITPGVPVPRRASSKKRLSSRNSTLGEDEDESEEIKVSMSEESFDSFAALMPEQNVDDEEDNDEEQEGGSRENEADVLSADSTIDDATTDDDDEQQCEQRSQVGVQCEIGMPNIQIPPTVVTAGATTVAIEVAPIVLPNVCPCPPKKRQRLLALNDDAAATTLTDTEAKINTNTTQQQQQQIQQTQEHTRPASVSTAANDFDFDDAFLQGLRPEMKVMTFQQKVYFKRRIYDLLGEIFPHTSSLQLAASVASSIGPNESGTEFNSNEMLRRLNTLLAPTLSQPPIVAMPVNYNNKSTNANVNNNNNNNNSNGNTNINVVPTSVLMPPRLRAVGRPNPVAIGANAAQRTAPQLFVRLPKAAEAATPPFITPLSALFLKEEAPDHSDN